jgi:transcriptional regulator with XRE-family HTH domain
MTTEKQDKARRRIAHRLRALRLRSGMTQAELGRRVGFASATSISSIELARRPLYGDEAAVFAQALGCGERDILGPDAGGCPKARSRGLATLLAAVLLAHVAAAPADAEETRTGPLLIPLTPPAPSSDGRGRTTTPRIESDNCDPSPTDPAIHLGS